MDWCALSCSALCLIGSFSVLYTGILPSPIIIAETEIAAQSADPAAIQNPIIRPFQWVCRFPVIEAPTTTSGIPEKNPPSSIMVGIGHLSALLAYDRSGIRPAAQNKATTTRPPVRLLRLPATKASNKRRRNGIASSFFI